MTAEGEMEAAEEPFSHEKAVAAAYSLYWGGRYREAGLVCDELLRRDPEQFDALYLRGLLRYRAGDAAAAKAAVECATRLRPEVDLHDYHAAVARQRGQTDWLSTREWRLRDFRRFSQTDSFVISYPKCGRTWLRAMLGRYLLRGRAGEILDIFRVTRSDSGLPAVDFSSDDRPQHRPYGEIGAEKSMYAERTVVFLVRDPRDVVVSNYFQFTRRGGKERSYDDGFDGTLSQFIRRDIGGLRSVVRFYNVWAAARAVPRSFHLMTYEGLRADTGREFRRCLVALGLPDHGEAAIDDAVRFGSFENMRALEETNALGMPELRPGIENDPESFKVRRGKVGGYVDYLGPDDIAYMNDYLAAELDDFFAFYRTPASCGSSSARFSI